MNIFRQDRNKKQIDGKSVETCHFKSMMIGYARSFVAICVQLFIFFGRFLAIISNAIQASDLINHKRKASIDANNLTK